MDLVVNDPRMHPTNVFVLIYSTVMSKGGCFLQHLKTPKKCINMIAIGIHVWYI